MSNMKKLFAMVLAIVMVMSLATTAFAYDITLEGTVTAPTDKHSYSVYQIFVGELAEDSKTLSNIKYGANYGTKDAEVPASELEAITDAGTFARDIVSSKKLVGDPVGTLDSSNNWTITVNDPGYYLIVDDTSKEIADGDAYSAYIVQVVEDVKMNPKSEAPTLDKKITADDNKISGDITEDGKFDNVSVGSTVTYTLTGTIPARATDYDYYYYIINDTLSTGLTFNNDVKVTIDGKDAVEGTDYKLYVNEDGYTFQVALLEAKAHAGKSVVVTYTATLNENAVIGEIDGNPNTADLDYSNNPNETYDGTQDEDKPGKPDSEKNVPLGDTPDSTTRTYTTGIKLIKVDENGDPLTGAEFTITGDNVVTVLVVESEAYEAVAEGETGAYWKLKDGTYTAEAPVVEAYYKEAAEGATAGWVNEGTDDEPNWVEYNAESEDHAQKTVYIKVEANGELYDSITTKYKKVIEYRTQTEEGEVNGKAYVDKDGYLTFAGLGEGTYTIKETKTPDGYNTIKDITIEIKWEAPVEGSDDCSWSATASTAGDLTLNPEGVFELTIVNESGSVLPETGGMGTVIFYALGAVLVLAAVVLLVTKKRMSVAE